MANTAAFPEIKAAQTNTDVKPSCVTVNRRGRIPAAALRDLVEALNDPAAVSASEAKLRQQHYSRDEDFDIL